MNINNTMEYGIAYIVLKYNRETNVSNQRRFFLNVTNRKLKFSTKHGEKDTRERSWPPILLKSFPMCIHYVIKRHQTVM